MSIEAQVAPREYPWRMPTNWWTRTRHYFLYIVREFTALPLALWLLWFLVEIQRASSGPKLYAPHGSIGFVVFSAICLGFGLYHSVTFLRLLGVVTHIKGVPSRAIVLTMFGLWALATVVVGFVLIWFAR